MNGYFLYGGCNKAYGSNSPTGYESAWVRGEKYGAGYFASGISEGLLKSPALAIINGDSYSTYFGTWAEKCYQARKVWLNVATESNSGEGSSSCYTVGAHGNGGNFLFFDGHVESITSYGNFRSKIRECCTVQGETPFTPSVWGPNETFYPYSAN